MVVDPKDDCTFWYVNQYEKVNGSFNWSTHIGSFAFTGCTGAPAPVVSLSATKLAFVKTPIGQTSPSKSVTLSNTGNAVLNIPALPSAAISSSRPTPAAPRYRRGPIAR